MSISQKISILEKFKGDDSNTLMRRDILTWYVKSVKKGNTFQEFRLKDIGYWLFDHHEPFLKKYDRKTRKSYLLHSARTYITGKIEELVQLGIIEIKSIVKSEKNDTTTPLYSFTKIGVIIAWLTEAYFIDEIYPKERSYAIQMFFGELISYVKGINRMQLSDLFMEYLQKCQEVGLDKFMTKSEIEIAAMLLPSSGISFQNLRRFLMSRLYTDYKFAQIFVDILKKVHPLERKLIQFQLKLDIESIYYDKVGGTIDWETLRYGNIKDVNKVVIQGFCLECGSQFPYHMDVFSFMNIGGKNAVYEPQAGLFIGAEMYRCVHCEKKSSSAIIPVWYVPDGFANENALSIGNMRVVHSNLKDKGKILKISKSDQRENRRQEEEFFNDSL
jgi:hypothetical protein